MFITAELLRKYSACKQGIQYIERFYPEGIEMIDIIRDKHINKEFLHWGREHLTHTPEELEAYCAACNIVNSEGYWYSTDVTDSKYIVKSKNVKDSRGVFESSDIVHCQDIVNTDDAENSGLIFHSSMIDNCVKVCKGNNIVASVNVCNSTMVARSENVIDSNTVFDSSEIIKCNTVTNSHFCQDCKDIDHCLFCEGLTGVEYHIFNKPVDKNLYEMLEKQYKKYMTVQLDFIDKWPKDLIASAYITPTRKFDDWYHPISEKFWKWVRTLPNFDSMLIYNITMLPEILID